MDVSGLYPTRKSMYDGSFFFYGQSDMIYSVQLPIILLILRGMYASA